MPEYTHEVHEDREGRTCGFCAEFDAQRRGQSSRPRLRTPRECPLCTTMSRRRGLLAFEATSDFAAQIACGRSPQRERVDGRHSPDGFAPDLQFRLRSGARHARTRPPADALGVQSCVGVAAWRIPMEVRRAEGIPPDRASKPSRGSWRLASIPSARLPSSVPAHECALAFRPAGGFATKYCRRARPSVYERRPISRRASRGRDAVCPRLSTLRG